MTPIPPVLTAIGLHYVGSVRFSSDHTSLCPQGRRLRPDQARILSPTTRGGSGFAFLSWYLLFCRFFLTEARMMLEVGITWGLSNSDFTGITVLVLLESNFSFGDANSSGLFLCSKIAIQGHDSS